MRDLSAIINFHIDSRASLNVHIIYELMNIHANGPELKAMMFAPAIEKWKNQKTRLGLLFHCDYLIIYIFYISYTII